MNFYFSQNVNSFFFFLTILFKQATDDETACNEHCSWRRKGECLAIWPEIMADRVLLLPSVKNAKARLSGLT